MAKKKQTLREYTTDELKALRDRLVDHRHKLAISAVHLADVVEMNARDSETWDGDSFDDGIKFREKAQWVVTANMIIKQLDQLIRLAKMDPSPDTKFPVDFSEHEMGFDY